MADFCSGLQGRRPFWLLNPPAKGGSLPVAASVFLFWSCGDVGEDGDGCSRWSVAGGNDGELLRMQGRLFQMWQCVRDQAEQIVKIPPPPPPPPPHPTQFFELTWAIFYIYIYIFLCLQFLGFPI